MTWYAVYNIADGRLVSVGDSVTDSLPGYLAAVEIDEPDFSTHMWDAATLSLVPIPAPPAPPAMCDAFTFYRAFTPVERIAIRMLAKVDPIAEDFEATLDKAISSGSRVFANDPDLLAAMHYLSVTPSDSPVLSAERKAAILAVLT